MNCRRCDAELNDARSAQVCLSCAREIKSTMDDAVLSELTTYWERRLMEARDRDWT